MFFYHKELASGRWFELSLVEQMANIGSEVHRAIDWYRKKNQKYFEVAFEKALELYDLTLADKRWKGRRKEVARSREFFCGLFYGDIDPGLRQSDMDWLDKYFFEFGLYANAEKDKKRESSSKTTS